MQSVRSPTTPRPLSSALDRNGDFGFHDFGSSAGGVNNGLGSLADELSEEYWDEEEDMEAAVAGLQSQGAQAENAPGSPTAYHDGHNTGMDGFMSPARSRAPTNGSATLSPLQATRSRHRAKPSDYDGSDYGDSSDLEEVDGISRTLEARIAAIEGLARQGTLSTGTDADKVVERVADYLKDLQSQANVENHTTRYVYS